MIKSAMKRESSVSRNSENSSSGPIAPAVGNFRRTSHATNGSGPGNGNQNSSAFRINLTQRERIESTLDKWHDDDLSIVASDDDNSSSDGNSRANPSTAGKTQKTEIMKMVQKETQVALFLRYFIVLLLIGMATFLSIGVFRWVEKADLYDNLAPADSTASASSLPSSPSSCTWDLEGVQDAFVQGLENNMLQAQASRLVSAFSVSTSFTSWVLSQPGLDRFSTWPFVTIPDFETRVTGLLRLSASPSQVLLAHYVDPLFQVSFEEYALQLQQTCDGCTVIDQIYDPVTLQNVRDEDDSVPIWQVAPFSSNSLILQDLNSDPTWKTGLQQVKSLGVAVLTDFIETNTRSTDSVPAALGPEVVLIYPVFADFQQVTVASFISIIFSWAELLKGALPFDLMGTLEEVTLFVESCSGRVESYELDLDGNLKYTGPLPEISSELQAESVTFPFAGAYAYGAFDVPFEGVEDGDVCNYQVWVAPSVVVEDAFNVELEGAGSSAGGSSNRNITLTIVVAVLFAAILVLFMLFDCIMERRQAMVANVAAKSSVIVEGLFPAQVRDRMLESMLNKDSGKKASTDPLSDFSPNNMEGVSKNAVPTANGGAPSQLSVKQFLSSDTMRNPNDISGQPIADLFNDTTVLFADIAGFTAWSSQREPPQVFTLLETLYRSFDVIAKKLKVFKVETIGDCYMAVTGLPNPDEAHAVHMSRFAYQCLVGMKELIRELEAMLGPGTSELALRVGLHSGAVTAGVLRGDKGRFQLFGDTVNTASRMESTGLRGKIQVSQETAELLQKAGKNHWLKPRDEAVHAKGKGELKTYWLDPTRKKRNAKPNKEIRVAQEIALNKKAGDKSPNKPFTTGEVPFDDKYDRLIAWNVDVLLYHLGRVISARSRSPSRGSLVNHSSEVALLPASIHDVAEVVALPPFDPDSSRFRRARPDVSMLHQTRKDLYEYVKQIALTYRDVPFHNFEHASHVTLCVNKLLNRLINSEEYDTEEELHNATFGISSDPLTHFAIVFAALIHDADHTGLPNAQLVKDGSELAKDFNNKSVAEQNSVHIGWEMLMDPRFERLRKCIYQTNVERKRFRQLVINSVLATDIADKNINENRQYKWDRAFSEQQSPGEPSSLQIQEEMNRKATAVIEHIIQVSDVAHTMQHWHIYRRWNERLFHEMHDAYASGKVAVDPSTNWYIGELGFFDYYLIPLAMKLKDCGIFGKSGYEYISYVLKNKKEWERKGRQVVQEMVLLYKDVDEEGDGEDDSSFDSEEEYDSDDLEYESPGEMSSDDEDLDTNEDVRSTDNISTEVGLG